MQVRQQGNCAVKGRISRPREPVCPKPGRASPNRSSSRFSLSVASAFATSLASAFLVLALPTMASAHEPGAHVHGVAELRVSIDGGELEIALESPLDNMLGFEHAPRTDEQRAAVRTMAAKLRQAQTLFTPTAGAQCALASVQLASAALPADLLGEPKPAAPDAAQDEDGHADLDATFSWRCTAPEQLKGMDVGLIQAFPGVRKLNVQVVGPKGQSATMLSRFDA